MHYATDGNVSHSLFNTMRVDGSVESLLFSLPSIDGAKGSPFSGFIPPDDTVDYKYVLSNQVILLQ